jgi:sugar-specific transcriptional regulator TrmB
MPKNRYRLNIGLSDYAITAYIALLKQHPVNGSQLSRTCAIPRARIYDVLRMLKQKGFVAEASQGLYVPLPPDELIRRLRRDYEADLLTLETILEEAKQDPGHDFIWTIKGYGRVMQKAKEMIAAARHEIYVRLFAEEGYLLNPALKEAETRGVQIKYISMTVGHPSFALQVVHPDGEAIEKSLGGRSFDLVMDRKEFLGGVFAKDREDRSLINWGRNQSFVIAGRDSLRHDFFHYFLHKTYNQKQDLSEAEKSLYDVILKDI